MHSCGQARVSGVQGRHTGCRPACSAHLPGSPARRTAEPVPPGGGGAWSSSRREPGWARHGAPGAGRPSVGRGGGAGAPGDRRNPPLRRAVGFAEVGSLLVTAPPSRFSINIDLPSRRCAPLSSCVPDSSVSFLPSCPLPRLPGQSQLPARLILPLLPSLQHLAPAV